MAETRQEILQRSFSKDFLVKMENAIELSHYKYGWPSQTYPELAQAYKCIRERGLEKLDGKRTVEDFIVLCKDSYGSEIIRKLPEAYGVALAYFGG